MGLGEMAQEGKGRDCSQAQLLCRPLDPLLGLSVNSSKLYLATVIILPGLAWILQSAFMPTSYMTQTPALLCYPHIPKPS